MKAIMKAQHSPKKCKYLNGKKKKKKNVIPLYSEQVTGLKMKLMMQM